MRVKIALGADERKQLKALSDKENVAFDFWKRVAAERGLDYTTADTDLRGNVSMLPDGHGKHWCWPYSLEVKR